MQTEALVALRTGEEGTRSFEMAATRNYAVLAAAAGRRKDRYFIRPHGR